MGFEFQMKCRIQFFENLHFTKSGWQLTDEGVWLCHFWQFVYLFFVLIEACRPFLTVESALGYRQVVLILSAALFINTVSTLVGWTSKTNFHPTLLGLFFECFLLDWDAVQVTKMNSWYIRVVLKYRVWVNVLTFHQLVFEDYHAQFSMIRHSCLVYLLELAAAGNEWIYSFATSVDD